MQQPQRSQRLFNLGGHSWMEESNIQHENYRKQPNIEDKQVDHSSVQENNGSATQARIQCERCNQQTAKYNCTICKHALCQECDSFIHGSKKLFNHHRTQLKAGQKLEDLESENYIKIKISNVKQANHYEQLLSTTKVLTVNQKWDKIIHDMKIKFQQIINIAQDKMEEIIAKMEKKRQQEIRQCTNYLKELKGIRKLSVSEQSCKRSNISQKVQTLHPRLKVNQSDSLQDLNKVLGQIDINNNYFQQVKSSLQKIEIRNIISRTLSPQESEHKKKMRKSMQLNMNTTMSQAAYSSGVRSPKHAKMSFSTLIQQRTMQSSNNVTNQEQMDVVRMKPNQSKMLQKVKSEKIILKNTKVDASMVRRETAKLKKMEIMI